MWIAKLFSQGRITVPKEVRERLGLRPGDRVEFIRDGDGTVLIRRVPPPAGSPVS